MTSTFKKIPYTPMSIVTGDTEKEVTLPRNPGYGYFVAAYGLNGDGTGDDDIYIGFLTHGWNPSVNKFTGTTVLTIVSSTSSSIVIKLPRYIRAIFIPNWY